MLRKPRSGTFFFFPFLIFISWQETTQGQTHVQACSLRTGSKEVDERSPVLVHLGLPPFFQFLLMCRLSFCLSDLHLYPLACAENFALEVETATFLRVVHIKQLLESFHDLFEIRFAGLRGLGVEDPAGLIERQTAGSKGICGTHVPFGSLSGIFGGGLGLFVRFCEGSPEDSSAGDEDLADNTVGLFGQFLAKVLHYRRNYSPLWKYITIINCSHNRQNATGGVKREIFRRRN